jgi:hypothetical protein
MLGKRAAQLKLGHDGDRLVAPDRRARRARPQFEGCRRRKSVTHLNYLIAGGTKGSFQLVLGLR